MHYVTRRSRQMQKYKFGGTCPIVLFVGSALGPSDLSSQDGEGNQQVSNLEEGVLVLARESL
jgi:hypothetical protein